MDGQRHSDDQLIDTTHSPWSVSVPEEDDKPTRVTLSSRRGVRIVVESVGSSEITSKLSFEEGVALRLEEAESPPDDSWEERHATEVHSTEGFLTSLAAWISAIDTQHEVTDEVMNRTFSSFLK